MGQTWLYGAAINLAGSVLINLGTNVMKLGHNRRAAVEHRLGKKVTIRIFREWQIGVVFFIVGNLANFISFGYAAQSLLAALGSVQFVSNIVFASLVLKEKVTKTVVGATCLIVTGCVMLVLFGSHSSTQFTVEEMMQLYSKPAYVAYLIFLATVVVLMYCIYKCGKKQMMSVGISGLNHCWYRLLPVSYATFSGMIGTQSVLFSKILSTLLRVTIGGNSQLQSWFTWVIIFLFLLTSTFWISRLNKALKFFPAMIIVPTMQISWTFFSIISGMLYFQEYRDFTLRNGIMFTVAVMIVFVGVFLLTKMRAIEQRFSARLSGTMENEKFRGQSESEESQTSRIVVNGLLKSREVSWDDPEDVRSPIVRHDHLSGSTSSPCEEFNSNYGDLPIRQAQTNRASSQLGTIVDDDENTTANPHECFHRSTGSLLENVADDFSLDLWSSFKGTIGMGPTSAPALSLFGPPGVGFEKGSDVLPTINCTSVVTSEAPRRTEPELPIAQLPNEAPASLPKT